MNRERNYRSYKCMGKKKANEQIWISLPEFSHHQILNRSLATPRNDTYIGRKKTVRSRIEHEEMKQAHRQGRKRRENLTKQTHNEQNCLHWLSLS